MTHAQRRGTTEDDPRGTGPPAGVVLVDVVAQAAAAAGCVKDEHKGAKLLCPPRRPRRPLADEACTLLHTRATRVNHHQFESIGHK